MEGITEELGRAILMKHRGDFYVLHWGRDRFDAVIIGKTRLVSQSTEEPKRLRGHTSDRLPKISPGGS